MRWFALFLVPSCFACTGSLAFLAMPSSPSVTLIDDSCGDSEPGFDKRMAELASDVWTAGGRTGPVAYQTSEPSSDESECGVDRQFVLMLQPHGAGFTGRVAAVATERCSKLDCAIIYSVTGE